VLLALNLLSIVIAQSPRPFRLRANPLHIDAGFSINGWLAVLLTFLLARVFAEGALMREDLEGRCDMAISVKLDDLLHDRRMTLTSSRTGLEMALANLSILKDRQGARDPFSTLDAICEALSCQPGDILRFQPAQAESERPQAASKRSASR